MEFRFVWNWDRKILRQINVWLSAEIPERKIEVSLDEIETKIPELLETVQKDMFARVQRHIVMHISGMHIITKNLRILQKINRDSSAECGAAIRHVRTRSKKIWQ